MTEAGCSVTEFGVAVCGKRTLSQLFMLTWDHKACDQRTGSVQNGKYDTRIMEHWIWWTDESHEIKFHYYMINLCHSYSTRVTRLVTFNMIFYSEQANNKNSAKKERKANNKKALSMLRIFLTLGYIFQQKICMKTLLFHLAIRYKSFKFQHIITTYNCNV